MSESKGQRIVRKRVQYMAAWASGDKAKADKLFKELKSMYKYIPKPIKEVKANE